MYLGTVSSLKGRFNQHIKTGSRQAGQPHQQEHRPQDDPTRLPSLKLKRLANLVE